MYSTTGSGEAYTIGAGAMIGSGSSTKLGVLRRKIFPQIRLAYSNTTTVFFFFVACCISLFFCVRDACAIRSLHKLAAEQTHRTHTTHNTQQFTFNTQTAGVQSAQS